MTTLITPDSKHIFQDLCVPGEHPGMRVKVTPSKDALPQWSPKKNFLGNTEVFSSRDELLRHELACRIGKTHTGPFSKRYLHIPLSLAQRVKVFFGWHIDHEIQDHPKVRGLIDFNRVPADNWTQMITPSKEIREELKLNGEKGETHRLSTRVFWSFNSPFNGFEYKDKTGKTVRINQAVTASRDFASKQIAMMRRIEDKETGQTHAYTGRPDTKAKALEQATFIFQSEMQKKEDQRVGITKTKEGTYVLNYIVNDLLSPVSGLGYLTYDEKQAVRREQKVLEQLLGQTVTIDGKKVRLEPLHFLQPLNRATSLTKLITDSHSGKGLAKSINMKSYKKLLLLAQQKRDLMPDGYEKKILSSAIDSLEKERPLLPEEELFNRALICHILGFAHVAHCKSNTDRTTIGTTLITIAKQFLKLKLDLPTSPHAILQTKACRELFLGHILAAHPMTRIARTDEKKGKKEPIDLNRRGFAWSTNPVVGRLLPERYIQTIEISPKKKLQVAVLSTLGCLLNLALVTPIWIIGVILTQNLFFNPLFMKPTTSFYVDKLIDPNSPFVGQAGEGRSLLR